MKMETLWNESLKRTFRSYVSMVERVLNLTDKRYERYRTMEIEEDWVMSFKNFLEDVGERPEGTTLDRIDNTLGYIRGNVRWANPKTQCRNRGNTLKVVYKGEERVLIELCEELSVDYEIVRARLKIGISLEEALSKPKRYSWTKIELDGKLVGLKGYCAHHEVDYQLIRDRLRNGWSLEKAIETPKMNRGPKATK